VLVVLLLLSQVKTLLLQLLLPNDCKSFVCGSNTRV
jgi:hypothetical protein